MENQKYSWLRDHAGKISCTRLVNTLIPLSVVYVWVIISLVHMKIAEIPVGVAGIVGLTITGKVVQSIGKTRKEKKNEST